MFRLTGVKLFQTSVARPISTSSKLCLATTPNLENQSKQSKGKRGGKIRTGKFNQMWQAYPSPRKHQGHKLVPGFHKYRWLNPDCDRFDIWKSVKDPNAITKFNSDRQGTPLTKVETEMPRIPPSNWQNFSYHFHADTYHFIRANGTLKNSYKYAKYETKWSHGQYEDMRRCFHLLKVEQLKKAKTTGEKALTPRQVVEQAIDVCSPPVFPFKRLSKRLSKYKQYSSYTVRTYGRYTSRSWVHRAMRNAIFSGQRPRKYGESPIVWANEISKAANGEGRAYEQKKKFIQVALRERHKLKKF